MTGVVAVSRSAPVGRRGECGASRRPWTAAVVFRFAAPLRAAMTVGGYALWLLSATLQTVFDHTSSAPVCGPRQHAAGDQRPGRPDRRAGAAGRTPAARRDRGIRIR